MLEDPVGVKNIDYPIFHYIALNNAILCMLMHCIVMISIVYDIIIPKYNQTSITPSCLMDSFGQKANNLIGSFYPTPW